MSSSHTEIRKELNHTLELKRALENLFKKRQYQTLPVIDLVSEENGGMLKCSSNGSLPLNVGQVYYHNKFT